MLFKNHSQHNLKKTKMALAETSIWAKRERLIWGKTGAT